MHSRRKYLAGVGAAVTAVAVSGCMDALEQEPDPPEEDNLDMEIDAFHSAESGECTDIEEGEISINQHPDFNNSIMFNGTILTPDPAHEAEIADDSYDEETGVVTLVIEASSTTADDEASVDCVGEVEYSGGLMFEGEPPLTLRIEHNTSADDAVEELNLFD